MVSIAKKFGDQPIERFRLFDTAEMQSRQHDFKPWAGDGVGDDFAYRGRCTRIVGTDDDQCRRDDFGQAVRDVETAYRFGAADVACDRRRGDHRRDALMNSRNACVATAVLVMPSAWQ